MKGLDMVGERGMKRGMEIVPCEKRYRAERVCGMLRICFGDYVRWKGTRYVR